MSPKLKCLGPTLFTHWIIRAKGGFGHEWVVGDNHDANETFWASDFQPNLSSGKCLSCSGIITFYEKSEFDPDDLDGDEYYIRRHVVTSPATDACLKDYVKRLSKRKRQPDYAVIAFNCRDFANMIANLAEAWEKAHPGPQPPQ